MLSCVVATIGGGLTYISLVWLSLKDHNSVGSVAMVMLCFWLPTIILSPVVGVVVDRVKAQNILLAASTWIRAVILILFGFVFLHQTTPRNIDLLALVLGIFSSFYMPSSMRLTRDLVPKQDLLHANATIDMVYEVGNMIGMGLAGFLIAWVHGAGTLFINAALFMLSGTVLCIIKSRSKGPDNRYQGFMSEFKLGLHYIQSNKSIFILYSIQLIVFIEYMTAPVLLAPYAKNVLHTNASQFGYIETMLSMGIITGGLFITWLVEKVGFIHSMTASVLVMALTFIIFSHNTHLFVAEITYFIFGVCCANWPVMITKATAVNETVSAD